MKISTQKFTWTSASVVLTLLAGVPAVADDTELLLLSPDPSKNPKPNVMFILDSSGSMGNPKMTTRPYDSAVPYTGDCDSSALYWTDVDTVPDCDTTTQYVNKSAYKCDFSNLQISGIGSYTDTMVMFRDDAANDDTSLSWRDFAPGYHDSLVECQADSAKHGDGSDATVVYATAGSDLGSEDAFTSAEGGEISWGSPPRNVSYTVYDGNYLNWKASPVTEEWSKTNIMKAVTKKVLSSVNNLNVGLMRFNGNDGGPVILDITDLDENRQTVLDAVDEIPAGGNTPLSEVLYESALFWLGMPANYGTTAATSSTVDGVTTYLTDPNALVAVGTDPEVYEQPEWDVCAKNYNVLLTDGIPREDFDTPDLIANLPDSATVLGYAGCDGDVLPNGGQCLDDVAEYLSKYDIDSVADEDQLVVTHTIGFDIELPLLEETAANSGGEYFEANDVESLTRTLLSIIANINDRSLSFTAPAVSVNTFNRTRNLNDLYITTFGARGRVHWPGNLKKYRVKVDTIVDADDEPAVDAGSGFFKTTAQSFWTTGGADGNDVRRGGAAQQLPAPLLRDVYTNNGDSDLTVLSNAVSAGNVDSFAPEDLGLTGAAGEPSKLQLIAWARGVDVRDEFSGSEVRKVMGDPLHSQPAAVVYGGTEEEPDVVVYTATNDGYLHAISGATGEELWSFIPNELLPSLTRLYFDPRSRYKNYGIDGNIVSVVKDVDDDGVIEPDDEDFVYIVFGMRRGGTTYYALDVSRKESPQLLWNVSYPEFGESWSTPSVARVKIAEATQNDDEAVVIIGGGYDTVHDTAAHPAAADSVGAGVHFLDLVSGERLWRAGIADDADLTLKTEGREMDRAIPNEIRVIDLSGDGYADRMYATDLGGQVWRFDIFNDQTAANLVTGGVIAQLGAEGVDSPTAADTRRFYNAPDVSLITDNRQQRRYVAVSVGTGYRAHPFDLTATDRFYSLRDSNVFNQLTQDAYNNFDIAVDGDLVEVSGQTQTVVTADDRGWKFTVPDNEKIVTDSLTFNNEIFFVGFTPDSDAEINCSAGVGVNFLYRMSAINGDPIVPNIGTLDPGDSNEKRRSRLQQGGIAPSPTVLFPSPEPDCEGEQCNPPPLYCVGVECNEPGFDNVPVRTLWTQDGIE